MQVSAIQSNLGTSGAPKLAAPDPAQLGKEDFLRLLVTQLEYQDPMNPVSNEEFIAQTAQFSALEQMQNLNSKVEGLVSLQHLTGNAALVDYLGKVVEAPGSTVQLVDGSTMLGIELPAPAMVEFQIQDGSGQVVRTITTEAQLPAGAHRFVWDGTDDEGLPLPDGLYHVESMAADGEGNPIPADPFVLGKVTGLLYEDNTTRLRVNEELVDPTEIRAVIGE